MENMPKILQLKRNGEFYDYIDSMTNKNKDLVYTSMTQKELSDEFETTQKVEKELFGTTYIPDTYK